MEYIFLNILIWGADNEDLEKEGEQYGNRII